MCLAPPCLTSRTPLCSRLAKRDWKVTLTPIETYIQFLCISQCLPFNNCRQFMRFSMMLHKSFSTQDVVDIAFWARNMTAAFAFRRARSFGFDLLFVIVEGSCRQPLSTSCALLLYNEKKLSVTRIPYLWSCASCRASFILFRIGVWLWEIRVHSSSRRRFNILFIYTNHRFGGWLTEVILSADLVIASSPSASHISKVILFIVCGNFEDQFKDLKIQFRARKLTFSGCMEVAAVLSTNFMSLSPLCSWLGKKTT